MAAESEPDALEKDADDALGSEWGLRDRLKDGPKLADKVRVAVVSGVVGMSCCNQHMMLMISVGSH